MAPFSPCPISCRTYRTPLLSFFCSLIIPLPTPAGINWEWEGHFRQGYRDLNCRFSPLPCLLQILFLSFIPIFVAPPPPHWGLFFLYPSKPRLQQLTQISSSHPLHLSIHPIPQLQQSLSGNSPANSSRDAGRPVKNIGRFQIFIPLSLLHIQFPVPNLSKFLLSI